MVQLAQTTMRSELGKITLDKTFEERATLNLNIVESIRCACSHNLSSQSRAYYSVRQQHYFGTLQYPVVQPAAEHAAWDTCVIDTAAALASFFTKASISTAEVSTSATSATAKSRPSSAVPACLCRVCWLCLQIFYPCSSREVLLC